MNEQIAGRNILTNLTAKAKTPKGLATELKRQLVKHFGINEQYIYVWSPKEAAQRGYGPAWCLCAEEGPFEWAVTLTGYNKGIYDHEEIFSEPYNNSILSFSKK